MKIGPKYKIARRLGAQVFEKTQTQKFAFRSEKKRAKFNRPRSNYGIQLIEKQKARITYGISEKQFANYVKEAIERKGSDTSDFLFKSLERRLDNVVYRAGFLKTRRQARQGVSHGHFIVNGRKVTVPSYRLEVGDKVSIKESSADKSLFVGLADSIAEAADTPWLSTDLKKKEIEVKSLPSYNSTENHFDLSAVVQFYKR